MRRCDRGARWVWGCRSKLACDRARGHMRKGDGIRLQRRRQPHTGRVCEKGYQPASQCDIRRGHSQHVRAVMPGLHAVLATSVGATRGGARRCIAQQSSAEECTASAHHALARYGAPHSTARVMQARAPAPCPQRSHLHKLVPHPPPPPFDAHGREGPVLFLLV